MASKLMRRFAAIGCAVLVTTGAHAEGIPDALTLPGAIELARQLHPDLRVARADLAVARADSQFAGIRALNPELEFRSSRGGRSLGSGTDGGVEFGISQELELWGKRAARQSVATAHLRTSAAELNARSQQVESDIRARFERALFLQDRLETLGELADLDRRVVLATQARVRDGSITPLTGRLTELDLLRLEAQGRRARSDYRQARVALGLAIGLELPDSTRLNGELRADSLQTPEDSVIARALRVRAEGEVFHRQLDERRAQLHLARSEARPNLTVGAGLAIERQAFAGDDFSGDPAIVRGIAGARDTDHLWQLRVSVPVPLFQKNQAGGARAAAEVTRSQAEYDRYLIGTRLAVLGAVRRFEEAAGLYRTYLDRSTRVREDLVLVREAYADGRIALDSYLMQKGRLVDTLIGQLEAADAYWDARGALEIAVGLDLAHLNQGGER
jgi:cobalt-zinc-cadmium efflux system outer membrane protein